MLSFRLLPDFLFERLERFGERDLERFGERDLERLRVERFMLRRAVLVRREVFGRFLRVALFAIVPCIYYANIFYF
jgi:hypothetical protein